MMHLITVAPGEEVMDKLSRQLKELEISAGAIVSVIGAVDQCCISNMPANDSRSDILTEYNQPFEMSGTGDVTDGVPHIHCVLGAEGDAALSGHLHWAKIRTWFVKIYVLVA